MSGKVFTGGRHTCIVHAGLISLCKFRHDLGAFMQGTIADNGGYTEIEVQYRCKTEINTHGAQFRSH